MQTSWLRQKYPNVTVKGRNVGLTFTLYPFSLKSAKVSFPIPHSLFPIPYSPFPNLSNVRWSILLERV
jgi:hypothetical protein